MRFQEKNSTGEFHNVYVLNFENVSRLLTFGTGLDFTEERLDRACREIIDTERRFNLREGMDPSDDTLPERFLAEPLKEGATAGAVVDLQPMLRRYYELRGWTDGRPSAK